MNLFDKKKYPNTWEAHDYAEKVISGKIPACIYVVGACKRFLRDLNGGETFYFDVKKSEKYLKHVQQFHHVKGKHKTPEIKYEPWQKFCWANIMGFIDKRTGKIRFRTAHIEVPRGNGKSPMAGQAVLFFLALDEPEGNEISCIASKTEQAKIVLNNARNMAKKSKDYLDYTGVEVREHTIIHPPSNSIARALSSDDKSLDGLTDVLAVMDELHAVPRDLFDVVKSGMKKRNDSLTLCITTAGMNKANSGYTQSVYAKKVALGQEKADSFFAAIWTVDEGDDIFSSETWKKANPNWGVSVDPITFEEDFNKAKVSPADLPGLKVKNLNIWLDQGKAYFDMAAFEKCKDELLHLGMFKGKKCHVGVDLATVDDLCTRAYVFREKGIYYGFCVTFIAEEAFKKHNRDVYHEAVESGHLIVIPGEVVDLEEFRNSFIDEIKRFQYGTVAFDPYQAAEFGQMMMKKGFEMTEFRQNTLNFTEPMKKLYSLILEGKFKWNGSPVTRWNFGNTLVKPDAAGRVRPLKENLEDKIDEVVALCMAIAPWINDADLNPYNERGIRSV